MPFCSNCGEEVKEDTKFCSKCGTAINTVDQPISNPQNTNNGINCPNCGSIYLLEVPYV